MALALKSIDEIPAFMKAANEVIHDYPGTDEAIRSELLIGQFFYEKQDYSEAKKHLGRVADSSFVFERDLARYRLGLIELANEKYQPALDRFEQVITDSALKEQDNPYSVSLQSKSLKSDLKREALVDSVRAYTQLHGKGGDPVGYYARIAPSEIHFQEVIEKLAVRYIYLKNYDAAVKLLRSLSERSADPQRVVNIYREVLVMIPIAERAHIPVSEMRFVLDQYHRWISFFDIPKGTREDAHQFFEKQVRELGTRNHAIAKEEKDSKEGQEYLARAREYYLLYLGAFAGGSEAPKMAANLADVYFVQKDWVHSGEYYLRTYAGEFGPADSKQKDMLMDNALLCLQKETGDSFYESVRRRGLMIRALDSYIASSEKRKQDPSLAFLRAKTRYEQGVFPQALDELYVVAQRFPSSPQATQSGEIILDYFNVRNDYEGLGLWSGKLLTLRLQDGTFKTKLASIQSQAHDKIIEQRVHQSAGFDQFAQAESYLKTALASSDSSLADQALREALAKSREERDFQTYLKTASILGDREQDPLKKAEILDSVAQEDRKVGRFYESIGTLKEIYSNPRLSNAKRNIAFDQAVQTTLALRDWNGIAELSQNELWKTLSADTVARVRQAWTELLESPIRVPDSAARQLATLDTSDEGLLALYKAQERLPLDVRAQVSDRTRRQCASGRLDLSVCRWESVGVLDSERAKFRADLAQAPLVLDGVQKMASEFQEVLQKHQQASGSKDPQLEIALQVRMQELYRSFASYLHKVSDANPDFKQVLSAKAAESEKAAQESSSACQKMAAAYTGPQSVTCESRAMVATADLLRWPALPADQSSARDPGEEEVVRLQKKLFNGTNASESELDLSKEYLARRDYHHSLALAAQGMAKHPELAGDFKTVLGCSAYELGYVREAAYHLDATQPDALKKKCGVVQ